LIRQVRLLRVVPVEGLEAAGQAGDKLQAPVGRAARGKEGATIKQHQQNCGSCLFLHHWVGALDL
jgi:hypothetical protein